MYKFATWNVNSIQARLEHVETWLSSHEVSVLALQETKCIDEQFPFDTFFGLDYQVVVSGQKSYNGMALLSKSEAEDVVLELPDFTDPQRRLIAATVDGIRYVNVYVPNGQSLDSEKFQYKQQWLEALHAFIGDQLLQYPELVLLGDFNIAPTDEDVFDPKVWRDCVLVSERERTALHRITRLGLVDSFRLFKQPQDAFSWWDYRGGSFRQNKGLRIDLALISKGLVERCKSARIDKTPRAWLKPSDHAPVVVSLYGD